MINTLHQIYIHGRFPGGNEQLKAVLKILGYERVVSMDDCKSAKEMILEITRSTAFYTNRIVEDEFEFQLADQLGLDIITNQKLQTMMINKLCEVEGGSEDDGKE